MRRSQASEEAGGVLPPGPEQGQVQSQEVLLGKERQGGGWGCHKPCDYREKGSNTGRGQGAPC